jgi:hypothetical protein
MHRLSALTLLACLMAGASHSAAGAKDHQAQEKTAPRSATNPAVEASLGDFVIGKPITYKNLTVFPVVSKTPQTEDRYLTLDEGLKSKRVEVYEVGAEPRAEGAAARRSGSHSRRNSPPNEAQQVQQAPPQGASRQAGDSSDNNYQTSATYGDVNHLVVINRSEKPLYLMPGELIYGGKQDRCVAAETIIPADKKPVTIAVFCVEHGRWSDRGYHETVEDLASLQQSSGEAVDREKLQNLAEETRSGKFVAEAGSLNKQGRVAVQEGKGQGEVWNEVGQINAALGTRSSSNAFTENYTNAATSRQLQTYLKEFQEPVAKHPQVVGALVAVNGKVEAVDIFQSTPLFQKLWPKLLKSHALDAVAVPAPKTKKDCTTEDARKFLDDAMHAGKRQKSQVSGGLAVTQRDSEKVISFCAEGNSPAAPAQGEFGKGVHSAGYSK